jgi:hypothetical protein
VMPWQMSLVFLSTRMGIILLCFAGLL